MIGPGGVCSWHLPCSQGTVVRALAYSLQLSFLPLPLSPFPFLLLIRSAGGDALLGAICCGVCPGLVASRRGADRGWEDSTEAACWLQPLAVRVGNHQTSRRAVCGKILSVAQFVTVSFKRTIRRKFGVRTLSFLARHGPNASRAWATAHSLRSGVVRFCGGVGEITCGTSVRCPRLHGGCRRSSWCSSSSRSCSF